MQLRVIALRSLALMAVRVQAETANPSELGLLIGAAISAVLWAAIGAVMFFPSGATKIASLLAALV